MSQFRDVIILKYDFRAQFHFFRDATAKLAQHVHYKLA